METYLAILFFLLITGLIILINAILCRTWTDLAELLIIAAVWTGNSRPNVLYIGLLG